MAYTEDLEKALEALIFATDGPVGLARLKRVFPRLTQAKLASAVSAINAELARDGRPYEVVEVGAGFQFRTHPEYAELIRQSRPERKLRLSRAALESLAVIAYRQPITRAELEELRCVDCGAVIKSLLDRNLVRIVGRRDAPGRPALYGSTSTFLETFGLKSLRDMPALRELESMVQNEGTAVELAGAEDADAGADDGASPPAGSADGREESEGPPPSI